MNSGPQAFDMGRMAFGGIGQMLDSLELVKRAWSTLNLPSQMVPTVDVDELDKRIADLKAVEQWLNVNLSMLRGTIQGLEIQRGTLAAVKAFGATLGTFGATDPVRAAAPASDPAPRPAEAAPRPRAPEPPAAAAPAPAPAPVDPVPPAAAGEASAALPSSMMPGINPSAWWNLLQQNFNQVAEAALSGVGLQGVTTTASTPAASTAAATAPRAGKSATGARTRSDAPKPARGRAAPKTAATGKATAPRKARTPPRTGG
jgi:hypothetical protein